MKKNTILFLLILVNAVFVYTSCSDKEETDPRNAKFHQEILPKGRKSDVDTTSSISVGAQDSISRGLK